MAHVVEAQLDTLVARLEICGTAPRRLVDAFAGAALRGPFRDGRRRLSAINRDGVPFQWSVSAGARRGGLRFIADCVRPGMTIAERVRHTRSTLATFADELGVGRALPALDRALEHLLPDGAAIAASLMGLCVAAEIERDGRARLKVYANGEAGPVAARWRRIAECLAAFGRARAVERLGAVAAAVGERLTPAFVALDLAPAGVGRIKIYFRPDDGTPALQLLAARAAGCGDVDLTPLHRAFSSGPDYPARAVDLSLEFPADDGPPGFKVDLRTIALLGSDAEADRRVRRLLALVGADESDYCVARDVIVGAPSTERVEQIVFVGLAARGRDHQVDVYFHPRPEASS